MPTDPNLLHRAFSEDDGEAWSEIVREYTPMIRRFAFSIGWRERYLDDLIQEVLVTLLKKRGEFAYDPRGRFRNYLYEVVRRAAYGLGRPIGRDAEENGDSSLLESLARDDDALARNYSRSSPPPDCRRGSAGMSEDEAPGHVADWASTLDEASVPGYRAEALLGRGGQGAVDRAVQESTGRRIALKRIRRDESSRAAVERFARERELICRLRHPHVVAVLDAGVHGSVQWIAMELVEGATLEEWLRERPGIAREEAVRLLLPLCDEVAHAHRAGMTHRDLKPENVLMQRLEGPQAEWAPKIADFGLARALARDPGGVRGSVGRRPRPRARLAGSPIRGAVRRRRGLEPPARRLPAARARAGGRARGRARARPGLAARVSRAARTDRRRPGARTRRHVRGTADPPRRDPLHRRLRAGSRGDARAGIGRGSPGARGRRGIDPLPRNGPGDSGRGRVAADASRRDRACARGSAGGDCRLEPPARAHLARPFDPSAPRASAPRNRWLRPRLRLLRGRARGLAGGCVARVRGSGGGVRRLCTRSSSAVARSPLPDGGARGAAGRGDAALECLARAREIAETAPLGEEELPATAPSLAWLLALARENLAGTPGAPAALDALARAFDARAAAAAAGR